MVTHATVQAIQALSGRSPRSVQDLGFSPFRCACDWESAREESATMSLVEASMLLRGMEVQLPTCPTCALFVDLALQESGLTCGENVEAT